MPSGRTHDRLTWILLPCVVVIGYGLTRSGQLTLGMSSGFLFSGLMFGPDLDIHSVQYKRWGWLRWLWLPYRKMLRHRSFWSHGFLIGTALRLLYILLLFSLISLISFSLAILFKLTVTPDLKSLTVLLTRFFQAHYREAIALLIGLELGAMSHSISDVLGTAIKRSRKIVKKKSKQKQ